LCGLIKTRFFLNPKFWQRFAFATVGFLTLEFAAWLAATLLIVSAPLNNADAIVVLSGSATYAERTQRAAELYNKGVATRIILTNDGQQGGWSSIKQRNPFFYEMARDNLLRFGVPASQIEIVYQPVSGTYEEASMVRGYAEMRALGSLLFVTSAYHSRRALWTVRKVFGNTEIAIGLDAVETGNQSPSPLTWWLHLRGWEMIPEEYVKTIYYHLHPKWA